MLGGLDVAGKFIQWNRAAGSKWDCQTEMVARLAPTTFAAVAAAAAVLKNVT